MDERWLEVEREGGAKQRVDFCAGLTRIGDQTADVVLSDTWRGELHMWDEPAKAVNIGADSELRVAGKEFDEHLLEDGDTIEWRGSKIVYRCFVRPPVLEEVQIETPKASETKPSKAPAGNPRAATAIDSRVSLRIRAGLIAELGLADKSILNRWQHAVMQREFDADLCARELLSSCDVSPEDTRLLERSSRLTRDLIMAPLQTGTKKAGRKARGAAKSGAAFLVAQLIVVGIFSLMVLILMVVVHEKWPDFSFDDFLHQLVPWND